MKEPQPSNGAEWRHYTVGFMFNEIMDMLILIRKAKPEWQKGKLNGVGGSFEEGENKHQCMVREFFEETGIKTKEQDWKYFATGFYDCHQGPCAVHYLTMVANLSHGYYIPKMDEKEQASWLNVEHIKDFPHIPNLAWLIPMAKLKLSSPGWREDGEVKLSF